MSVVEVAPRTETVTEADVLERAADLLEEFGWCQHAPARDEFGLGITPLDRGAVSFCMTGAFERAIFDLTGLSWREMGTGELIQRTGWSVKKHTRAVGVPDNEPQ